VNRTFQGRSLGGLIVAEVIRLAREIADRIGCRYVTVDARHDLMGWYERGFGFERNRLMQEHRVERAVRRGHDPEHLAISMRFDIRKLDED
jgi:hypothetical protein